MKARNDVAFYAEAFVGEFGEDCGQRLQEIGPLIGLAIREVDGVAFDGALVRIAGINRGRVALRRDIREEGRKRFTLGHEIGHYVLPGHGTENPVCRSVDIENWDTQLHAFEREANGFAARILMPRQVFASLKGKDPSFETIRGISRRCGTSLTASAVRYAEMSSERVAVTWSAGGSAKWYRASSEFGRAVRLGVLSSDSIAAACFAGSRPPGEFAEVPATAWLYDSNLRDDATIWEWSVAVPYYDGVLTLLQIPGFIEYRHDYQDADDESLDPQEFTLDRKRWPGKR